VSVRELEGITPAGAQLLIPFKTAPSGPRCGALEKTVHDTAIGVQRDRCSDDQGEQGEFRV